MAKGTLAPTTDDAANALLNDNPLALLIGMLLDQQIPIEWAFMGPYRLAERLDGDLDAAVLAALTEEQIIELFVTKPALHRYPAVMARRTRELCEYLVGAHDNDPGSLWRRARSADRVWDRLIALPGFGEEKAMITMAVLAKRFGVTPKGWEALAGPFADDQPRTVADVDGPEAMAEVRAWKKAQK